MPPPPPAPGPSRERPAPAATSEEWWKWFEESVGKRWITWAGAVVLILAAGLFVKYAFDHQWLGPAARVALGVAGGLAIVGAGEYFLWRRMRPLGQGLIGGGIGILFLSLYASYGFYGLVSNVAAFAMLAAAAALCMVLALAHDAIVISFLSVVGGFLTPALLSTGLDPRDPLFAYLLALDLAVLGVSAFKKWRGLDTTAFAGTWIFYAWWFFAWFLRDPAPPPAPAALWAGAFAAAFLASSCIPHLVRGSPLFPERLALIPLGAGLSFVFAREALWQDPFLALGLAVAGAAAAHLALGALARRRLPGDPSSALALLGIAFAFAVIAPTYLFDGLWVQLAWTAEAPAFMALACRFDYRPVRLFAPLPLLLAGARAFWTDWAFHVSSLGPVWNPWFGSALLLAASGGATAWLRYRMLRAAEVAERIVRIGVSLASGFFALAAVHAELASLFAPLGRPHAHVRAAALAWVAGSAAFFAAGVRGGGLAARLAAVPALGAAAALVVHAFADGPHAGDPLFLNARFFAAASGIALLCSQAFWARGKRQILEPGSGPAPAAAFAVAWLALGVSGISVLHFQTLAFLAAIGIMALAFYAATRDARSVPAHPEEAAGSTFLIGAALFFLPLATSCELAEWFDRHEFRDASHCLFTLAWALAPAGYLAAGLALRSTALRIAAVPFLGISALVVFALEAARAHQDFRLFANGHFAVGAAAAAVGVALAFAHRGFPDRASRAEWPLGKAVGAATILLTAALVTGEVLAWFSFRADPTPERWILPCVWLAAWAATLFLGLRLPSHALRLEALVPLGIAVALAIREYGLDLASPFRLYLNGRFLSCLAAAAAPFAYSWGLRLFRATEPAPPAPEPGPLVRLYRRVPGPDLAARRALEGALAAILFWAGLLSVLLLSSVETYVHFLRADAGGARAKEIAQMALSIVWAVSAIAWLAFGFWRRVRSVRLFALGLLGATALKLVIVDMARYQEIYRIVSFFVVGALMIGASYLYHRVEKRLEAQIGGRDGGAGGEPGPEGGTRAP